MIIFGKKQEKEEKLLAVGEVFIGSPWSCIPIRTMTGKSLLPGEKR